MHLILFEHFFASSVSSLSSVCVAAVVYEYVCTNGARLNHKTRTEINDLKAVKQKCKKTDMNLNEVALVYKVQKKTKKRTNT